MTRIIYNVATTLDGFIADAANSLDWLFAVENDPSVDPNAFMRGIGVLVEGSTTYEWVLREQQILQNPERWHAFYGDRPTYVFTSRQLPVPAGADVRFVSGPVSESLSAIRQAAGDHDVWVVGGGELAGQFFDADALDELQIAVAPVLLGAGAQLLPRRVESSRLRLIKAEKQAQFLNLTYAVSRSTAS